MLAYSILGFLAGTLSGLIGIGGGIVIVPALVYAFGLSQHAAQGTSLMLFCIPVAVLGALQYYRQGLVDLRLVGLIAAGFMLGSFLGAKLALGLPAAALKKIFAIILLAVAAKMLLEH